MMDILKQLMGRLHPILVHLPIGFIILGLLLQWYDRKKNELSNVISLIFLWGGMGAILASITGYLQYLGEGLAFDTVKFHLWAGILTTIFCFVMYARLKERNPFIFLLKIPVSVLSILFFILISYTGHLGGSITHGEDFLIEPLPNNFKKVLGFETFEEKAIILNEENWQDAQLYEEVVKPILNNKCMSCHSTKKKKGGLVLHTEADILKGGENGEVIIAHNALDSELFKRMDLPKTDEDHMPPKEKSQPSKEEIQLIRAWIDVGHPFDKSIEETGLSKDLFLPFFPVIEKNDYPDMEVMAASQDSIATLKKEGIHVEKISEATNFQRVSCINKPSFTDAAFELLLPLKTQIAVLDLGGTQVSDAIFAHLVELPHLTVLKLDNTALTGKNIALLRSLEHLKIINLTGTRFEVRYLKILADFKKLEMVYVYHSGIDSTGVKPLGKSKILVDYGNYELPVIPSDSVIY
tara:strand:- start:9102 stop:10499 length:1398 start_codon:yes stop_codon:yes gene_type:complete